MLSSATVLLFLGIAQGVDVELAAWSLAILGEIVSNLLFVAGVAVA